MPSVCFYFEVHQPYRLKPYGALQVGRDHEYFDDKLNAKVMRKVADKCYLPANESMLRLIERTDGRFRISYAVTGVAIEQMKKYVPSVMDSFVRLARTGAVEFVAETYYHSLAALYDKEEYKEQIDLELKLIEEEFGQTPRVFRNTELIYNDEIGQFIADLGFDGMICEGADDILDWRSPNFVYQVAGRDMRLLTKNYKLSDDIAFRFSNRAWAEYPLTADKFARWVHGHSGAGDVINLFMDYETFGEHQWKETGIFEFLEHLPDLLFTHPHWDILTPSQAIDRYPALGELPFHRTVSWADEARTSPHGGATRCSSVPWRRSIRWARPFVAATIRTCSPYGDACRPRTISITWLRSRLPTRRSTITSALMKAPTTRLSTT
jgi:alpha-amylase